MVVIALACLSALVLWAACFLAFKMDAVSKALERYGDRAFALEESNRRMEREHNKAQGALTRLEAHFVYPPVTEPVPLPSMDDTYAEAPKGKRKGKRG